MVGSPSSKHYTKRIRGMETQKTRVIFLCCHNAVTSQMAEAFVKHYVGDKFDVFSAGLKPENIHPMTAQVMQEIGINLSSHKAEPLRKYWGKTTFDYLITVCTKAEQECFIFPGVSHRLHWPIEHVVTSDQHVSADLEKFREIRNLVGKMARSWLKQILLKP